MKAAYLVLVLLLTTFFTGDPNSYPKDYFRSPLGIPLRLTGSFGEMRSNHFHSGLDIRTNAKVGYRIYAVADGWVSRINVSPSGYGKALYVQHPNGYTSVYAHLLEFSDEIQDYVKDLQYREQRFAVEDFPARDRFPVKQGDVIALSGNSGSTGGPHLHFEIRDSETEWPINPLLFGIPVADGIPPQVRRFKIYAADSNSYAVVHRPNGNASVVTMNDPVDLVPAGGNGSYRLPTGYRIEAYGRIGFGIEQRDLHNGSGFRLGAYEIDLYANDRPLYGFRVEKLGFPLQRYMNAHVDYEERVRNRRWVQRSFLLPGNKLPYYTHEGNGWLEVAPDETYKMEYRLTDVPGNTTRFRFDVAGLAPREDVRPSRIPYATLVPYGYPHVFTEYGIAASFPAGTFYDDLPLVYENRGAASRGYSDLHRVHDRYTPVHTPYRLSIAAPRLPDSLRSRSLIVSLDDDGDVSAVGGEYENGFVTVQTRSLGTFYVTADTTGPTLTPVGFRSGQSLRGNRSIRIRMRDDLSGIDQYDGYVDGEWVLFEYDPKRAELEHTFDGRISSGTHTLQLVARDNVGNTTELRLRFGL